MPVSPADGNCVGGVEDKVVFAAEEAPCGDLDAEKLAGAVDFKMFDGAGENLLLDLSAKAHGGGRQGRFGCKADGFRTEREERGAIGGIGGPAQAAADGDSFANFGAEEIGLADKLSGVAGGGAGVDFARRGDLLECAVF